MDWNNKLFGFTCLNLINIQDSGIFSFGGKFYNSFDDLAHHDYVKKRIYTVEEAATVVKPTKNTFKIRYL